MPAAGRLATKLALMAQRTAIISINASWNIVNFRKGLIAGLQRHGFRVVALAPPDAYSERFAELGVDYVPIEMDKKGVSPARDLLLLWRYYRILRELRPDIFLGYTAKPNVYGSLAAQALGIKVINNVSGLGTAFIRQGLLTAIVSRLYRLAFRRSATIFFQNQEDLDLFVGKRLVRAAAARLLPGSGIDISRFVPPVRGQERPFTFLLIARLLWDKGVGEYVEAARMVRAELPDARFQLLGFLDVENRTAVPRSEVEAWVAEGVIDYLGVSDDVRPNIAAADCVVLPSYREGLPRTLLEAAAMAKPLIATDAPGCRQVVREGVNGHLCAVRDSRSLADAMLRMARAPAADISRMGEAARRIAEDEYDERIVVERYIEAIEDALG
ncbi:MAG: glycosyltransferase family 1 protein [Alphaproteobacteria bacterium]|nr:glycosyltransferase family 1 protein [Alphaproteobacteria bacterium]